MINSEKEGGVKANSKVWGLYVVLRMLRKGRLRTSKEKVGKRSPNTASSGRSTDFHTYRSLGLNPLFPTVV